MSTEKKTGFAAFGSRIEELIERTGDIPPAAMMALMRRAEANPGLDIEKEMELLRTRLRDGQNE